MDPFVSSSGVFVYLSVVSEAFLMLRRVLFDSRQGWGPNPRDPPARPLRTLLRAMPPEKVERGWRGLSFASEMQIEAQSQTHANRELSINFC